MEVKGAKHCTHCHKEKILDCFQWINPVKTRKGRFASWCKVCVRRGMAEYQKTKICKEKFKAYRSRQEVKERTRELGRERSRRYRELHRESTVLEKLRMSLYQARWKLKKLRLQAKRDKERGIRRDKRTHYRRERGKVLRILIKGYEKEIKRILKES